MNSNLLIEKVINSPGGLRATIFKCFDVYKFDSNTRRIKKCFCLISLTNSGFFVILAMTDVGVSFIQFLKHMKFDGVQLFTNGFSNSKNKTEFVINNKMLTKIDLPF